MSPTTKYEVFIDGAKDPSPSGQARLADALATNYGLPLEQAKRVVAGGHFRVKRDVELDQARRYVSHLEGLGARASLAECGPRAATTSSPDLRAAARAAAPAVAPPARAPAPAPARAAAAAPLPAAPDLAPGPEPAAADAAVPDEFGISISGLMSDAAGASSPAPAAAGAPAGSRPTASAPPARPAAASQPVPAAAAPPLRPPAAPKPAPAAMPPTRPLGAGPTPPAPDAGGFSVVTLDGADDEPLELERGAAAGGANAFAPPGGAADDFLPPDEHAAALELAVDRSGRGSSSAPIADLHAPIEEVPLSDEKLNASRTSAGFGLEEAPPPPGSKVQAAPPPRSAAPVPPAPPSAWPSAGGAASRAAAPVGGLFGGRLRQSLAARVLLGVALCVAAAFIPASLYASRAHSTTIRALQHEERELRERLPAGSPQVRTPAVVREEIGSARTQAFVVTLFIWVTLAAVLGFLWFRYV